MTESSTTDRSKYVAVPDADLRLQRIWGHVTERLDARPARRVRWPLVGGGLLASVLLAVGVWVLLPSEPSGSAWEHATLQTASDSLDVALHDGSRIELFEQTRLTLAESEATAVEIALEQGRVECDVVPNRARRFVVRAKDVEVRVTGTRFSVERRGERVSVGVESGSVEVYIHREDIPLRKLSAGESWAYDAREARVSEHDEAAEVAPEATVAVAPSAATDAPRRARAADRDPPSDESGSAPLGAKELLERANQARRDGDVPSAARDYQRLLEQFPNDGRAGLSAFELGRLRMDRLGDLPGAVHALKRAVQLAPGSAFREDALARLVTAYQRLGQAAACARAREQYLGTFPSGVHAESVRRACGNE
jgi:TolA-binding protein